MIGPKRIVAFALCAALVAGATGSAAADPVQDNLRRLKERLKAARAKTAPRPPRSSGPSIRRRPVRTLRVPRVSAAPKSPGLPNPKYKYSVDYLPHRLGTRRNAGDILVETTNGGKTVFVYWKVEMISSGDGRGVKQDVAPGRYPVMLKGPTIIKPWTVFVNVKPGNTTLVKVTL